METPEVAPATYGGTLGAAIAAGPAQVREKRAAQIVEATRLDYRRRIEDLVMEIKGKEAQRNMHLDLSPDNSQCLISAKNFNASAFVSVRVSTTLDIKSKREDLADLVADYEELFGVTPNLDL